MWKSGEVCVIGLQRTSTFWRSITKRTLPKVCRGINELPDEQQCDNDHRPRLAHVPKRVAKAGPIKMPVGLEASLAGTARAQEMIMVGAAAVPEVELAEGTQCQTMAMVNGCFWGMRHQEVALQPTIAKLAILSGDQRPVLVETSQLSKAVGGKGEVA